MSPFFTDVGHCVPHSSRMALGPSFSQSTSTLVYSPISYPPVSLLLSHPFPFPTWFPVSLLHPFLSDQGSPRLCACVCLVAVGEAETGGSQLGVILTPRELGSVWRQFGFVKPGRGCDWPLLGAGDAGNTCRHRTASHNQNHPAELSAAPSPRSPGLRSSW